MDHALTLSFDQGTLLLRGNVPPLDLPDVRWDPRVGAWRSPAWRYAWLKGQLQRMSLPISDIHRPLPPIPAWSPPPLRPYQEAALDGWSIARRRGVVVLPTGSGKTRTAIAAIARCQVPALCLVPTRALLEQWQEALRAAGCSDVGGYGDGQRQLGAVTVATYESAWRWMPTLGDRFGLLVIDEAHHFHQGQRAEALEMSTAPWRLGLTATPPADPQALQALIGPVVYELGISDLAGSRFLSQFNHITLQVDLSSEERRVYEGWMKQFHEVRAVFTQGAPQGSWQDFAAWAARTPSGRQALVSLQQARKLAAWNEAKQRVLANLLERHRRQRLLVFTCDNRSAYAISRQHLLMPITCDIQRRERTEALQAFREGRLMALVSSQVLNEGLDVPDAEVAIIVGGRQGEREHVQRVGRLLRPSPGKRALIYELVTRRSLEVRQSQTRRRGFDPRTTAVSHPQGR